MRAISEKDMQIKEVLPSYKYTDKLYARYPLIGNAVLSESNLEKVYSQSKQIIDKFIEIPSVQSSAPLSWHLFVTLATINYAKKWNVAEESKFTKYITLQFGYRDDTGRIWNIIANSLEKALNAKKRFFLRDEGGREFYETVLVHSFAPENSWNSVFDLLYDFLKINLRWNYVKEDPIVDKMVAALADRINGLNSDDSDLIISAGEYRIRVGAKRLIQNRPEYTAVLFDSILGRIDSLIHNRSTESKCYVDCLVDAWFEKKIARMLDGERKQLSRGTRKTTETAITYNKIRASIYFKNGRLHIHIPAIRLEETGHRMAEVKVFEGNRIVGKTIPEIYGNELGETITECDFPISLSADSKCDLRVEVRCDSKIIYDSDKQLSRKMFIFKNSRECSLSSLKQGVYEMYIPDIDRYTFENVDILEQSGKYVEVQLLEEFVIKMDEKILAMDITNIRETTIAEPLFKSGVLFSEMEEKYAVAEATDSIKIFSGAQETDACVRLYVNDSEIEIGEYWDENARAFEVFLSDIAESGQVITVTIFDLEENLVLYKKTFYVISSLDVRFNKAFYLFPDDYVDATATIQCGDEEQTIIISEADSHLELECGDGKLLFEIPTVKYEWKNIEKMFPGECIWKDDLVPESALLISPASGVDTYVEIGNNRFSEGEIDLFSIVQKEVNASYNYQILLYVNQVSYKIGQLIFSEMFSKMPAFSFEDGYLLWDGGINYIGNDQDNLLLQLYSNEDLKYELDLVIGESRIELPADFVDDEYTYIIINASGEEEIILAQDVQFFGNPNKTRFKDKTIQINEVTEDTGEGSRPQQIKPVFVENIEFINREYIPSEDGVFDVYRGQMYFVRMDGTKKYYSNKYYTRKNNSFYKINPVKIIYINDGILRIVNEDNEGLYWFDYYGTNPRLEITDREPPAGASNYKDILFYLYGTKRRISRTETSKKDNGTVSTLSYSREKSIFDRFITVPQEDVITADETDRILVNAGPGTGKTWTLIERVIYLVDEKGIDPETILILCFSKAAVEVIKSRLKDAVTEQRVSEIVNQVDIRTFDSFASQVLYWVKDESEYDNLDYYEINKMNYDSRISLFNSVIGDIPEIISQCAHLIVDEVQDLVKERARMVIDIIRKLPEESGVTLLGDSCQSIYDYQAGSDSMTSSQFYKVLVERTEGFSYFTFSRNYRQGELLSEIGDRYRNVILSGNPQKCDEHWSKIVGKKIPEFEAYDIKRIDGDIIEKWIRKGTVGILTRTNGQALKISSTLRDKGIEHCLRKRLSDNSLNSWIAVMFNEYTNSSISEEEFSEIYLQINPGKNQIEAIEAWGALRDATRSSAERIGIRDILKGIVTGAKNTLLFSEETNSKLTVTNIHRGKGREFDTVLVEDDIFENEEKNLEEHKVCYVAITRPKQEIYRISAKAEYMRIDKDGDRRCYKSDFVAYNKQRLTFFEVGLENDIDLKSFAREKEVQEFIRSENYRLRGMSVVLIKANNSSSFVRYKIVLKETGYILGYTSKNFSESLERALRGVYHLPQRASLYFNVYPDRLSDIYIEDVISVVDQSDGSEIGVKCYGEMTSWNAISIIGYSKVEYI